jgi:hypothetical protein
MSTTVLYKPLTTLVLEVYLTRINDYSRETSQRHLLLDSVYHRHCGYPCSNHDQVTFPNPCKIRAFAAGRQPMLLDTSHAPLPQIDTLIDDQVWSPPGAVMGTSGIDASTWIGQRTMGSTTFHWTARLAVICRSVLHTLSVSCPIPSCPIRQSDY